jgi:hypothetical protein
MQSMARRMFELVEPIGVIPYSADEPNEAMFALGFPTGSTRRPATGRGISPPHPRGGPLPAERPARRARMTSMSA